MKLSKNSVNEKLSITIQISQKCYIEDIFMFAKLNVIFYKILEMNINLTVNGTIAGFVNKHYYLKLVFASNIFIAFIFAEVRYMQIDCFHLNGY